MSLGAVDAEDLLMVLAESTEPRTRVRDAGILCATAGRPGAVIGGEDVYPTIARRASALLHGVIRWQPLDRSNVGLAWRALEVSLGRVGLALEMPAAERRKLTDELTSGAIDSVDEITIRLAPYLRVVG
jgi:hypothetical protein